MAIQMRRGDYSDLDATKLLPGEFAIVTSGDPGLVLSNIQPQPITSDGTGNYVCPATGTADRLVTQGELNAAVALILAYVDAATA